MPFAGHFTTMRVDLFLGGVFIKTQNLLNISNKNISEEKAISTFKDFGKRTLGLLQDRQWMTRKPFSMMIPPDNKEAVRTFYEIYTKYCVF